MRDDSSQMIANTVVIAIMTVVGIAMGCVSGTGCHAIGAKEKSLSIRRSQDHDAHVRCKSAFQGDQLVSFWCLHKSTG